MCQKSSVPARGRLFVRADPRTGRHDAQHSNPYGETRMKRRQFVQFTVASLAAGAVAACSSRMGGFRDDGPGADPGSATPGGPLDATAYRATRRHADLPCGRIAYIERGQGDAALFLHGAPLNGFQWRGAIERLSPHRRCIAPDFMGLGYSEVPAGQSLHADAQAAMLAALL